MNKIFVDYAVDFMFEGSHTYGPVVGSIQVPHSE